MIPGIPTHGFRAAQAQAEFVQAIEEAEGESMTPYTPTEFAADWEFKIIRSQPLKQFGNQEIRERVLAEEAQAGWVVVEVFDNARIRLKRQRGVRRPEAIEGYDPYRTEIPIVAVPATPGQKAAGAVLLAGLCVGGIVAVLYAAGVLR